MRRIRWFLVFLILLAFSICRSAWAAEGAYMGVDLGVAEPTKGNTRAQVQTGASGSPFVGYMFNDYLGLQGDLQITSMPPDNDHRPNFVFCRRSDNDPATADRPGCANHQNQWTTTLGAMAGPRLVIPLGELVDIYGIGEGGFFTGLSGHATQSAPGFSVGGGLNVNLTHNFAVGLFGRWNRIYMSPRPTNLGLTQTASERIGEDMQYATAGVSLKYSFAQAPPPPPPPPPPPAAAAPPPPPVKKKIVLRSVHFDFNKYNIRSDAVPVLNEAVQTLKDEGNVAVVVEGHTDSIGSVPYNQKLSEKRANSVRNYLIDHGIAARRITAVGYGKSRPVASNDTADGRAQNRRVELRVE